MIGTTYHASNDESNLSELHTHTHKCAAIRYYTQVVAWKRRIVDFKHI